ncbi:hypothetical protein BD410DRAFT_840916 [Rickenella mellea]|uniref:HNH nuclease domain-containing protein n=1 Tax=Rickenella mellea TaxID=50990 RepID=A0A4Y7Q2C4_9AGAM|nr:hypothetical protein BD410DRAFT_840916 [Rickenella mellea]
MVLFPCPDPRDNSLEVGDIGPPPTQHLPRDSDEPVVPGHYMLFLSGASQFLSFWPELVMGEFPPRNTTGAQTGTRSSRTGRDDKTRRHVRMRDRRCLVTGQKVPGRERGANFNSMQSAHIFPLMGVGHEGWSEHVPDEIKTMVMTRQDADRPLNALLLRADVHILFDVYEWAVWVGTGPRHKIIRFEKSGAPSLGSYGELDLSHQYPSIGEVQPPNLGLLRHHFRVALLKHFKGFGMPLPPGRIDTLL